MLGLPHKELIEHHHGSHCLHNGHSAGHHTRIVASLGLDHRGTAAVIHGCLVAQKGGSRLESDAEIDGSPITNTPLYAPTMVGERLDMTCIIGYPRVIELAT